MLQKNAGEVNTGDVAIKVDQIDRQATGTMLVESNHGLMVRLFPSKRQRDVAKHELRLAKTECDFREKAIRIARDAQILAIEEMYNDYLVKGKTFIRRERTEFVLDQKLRMERELLKASDEFNQQIMISYESAEKIKLPRLREKQLELIDDSIDSFHNLATQLKEQFQNILNEGVQA